MRTFFPDEHLPSLLQHIALGGSLADWCRCLDHESQPVSPAPRPSLSLTEKWLRDPSNAEFFAAYVEAREIGYDALAASALRIARTPHMGTVTEEYQDLDDDGQVTKTNARKVRTEDALGHRKLVVDTSLKLLGLWTHRYSPRTRHGGDNDAPPIKMSSEERNTRIEAIVREAMKNMADGHKPEGEESEQ